jgi:hypothetical protein
MLLMGSCSKLSDIFGLIKQFRNIRKTMIYNSSWSESCWQKHGARRRRRPRNQENLVFSAYTHYIFSVHTLYFQAAGTPDIICSGRMDPNRPLGPRRPRHTVRLNARRPAGRTF